MHSNQVGVLTTLSHLPTPHKPVNSSASDGGPTPPYFTWAQSPPILAQCHPCHQHPGQLPLSPQLSASETVCNKGGSASTLGSIALDNSKGLRIRLPAPLLTLNAATRVGVLKRTPEWVNVLSTLPNSNSP